MLSSRLEFNVERLGRRASFLKIVDVFRLVHLPEDT
jgi:hypothetical protein